MIKSIVGCLSLWCAFTLGAQARQLSSQAIGHLLHTGELHLLRQLRHGLGVELQILRGRGVGLG